MWRFNEVSAFKNELLRRRVKLAHQAICAALRQLLKLSLRWLVKVTAYK